MEKYDSLTSEVTAFWDSNVSNWKVAAGLEPGSKEFFLEVERYRFEKLSYLERVVQFADYSGLSVLDVGCGLGTDTSRFAGSGAAVTAIDIAPHAIQLSKENFRLRSLTADFHVMNGESLLFDDNQFDFVYCHTVLHFTPRPAAMVQEIHRVLKPGGRALLMMINRGSWLYTLHRLAGTKLDYMDAPVFHKYNYSEFEALLEVFARQEILVERFPVRTEVHSGLKAKLYNTLFVDLYNSLPRALVGRSGYHLLARCQKAE